MENQNYTTTFLVEQSLEEVFAAINNVRGWWSEDIEGSTDALGTEFTYHYQDLHHSTQKITEWVPGKKVVWHVLDSHITFVKDKTEWNDTDIVFEITRKDDKTELSFTHVGLAPVFECYSDCSDAWSFYINDSLLSLITTGKGSPTRKESDARADLLHLLQIDHNHFTTVVTRLSDEEQQRPFTEEGWSVKDFLNHMTHWNNATNQLLIAYLHNQPLPPAIPAGDEANIERRRLDTIRSLQETHAYWEEVHATLQHLVQDEFDGTRLIERIRVPWDDRDTDSIGSIIAEMCGHDREHFDLIKSELLDRGSHH